MDRLAELEKLILAYYLAKGYKLEKDQTDDDVSWTFEVSINSSYGEKQLYVIFSEEGKAETVFYTLENTTKEMFDKAFEYFNTEKKTEMQSEC